VASGILACLAVDLTQSHLEGRVGPSGNLTSSHAAPPAVVTQDAYPVSPRRTDTPPGQEANSFWHLTLVVGPGASLLW
jgi:hypothetical protein